MSTRAVYGFRDQHGIQHVYVHHDGYPSGAAQKFANTLASKRIWALPRFEADEFGAGFIAVNKDSAGSVRLTQGPEQHGDIEYYYIVYQPTPEGPLYVEAYDVPFDAPKGRKLLFKGLLSEFIKKAEELESLAILSV
jgi:hypothetical protein